MNKLLTILLLLLCFSITASSYAQIDVKGKLKDKINRRANQRTDQVIDKGLNETEEGIVDIFSNDEKETGNDNSVDESGNDESGSQSENESRNSSESQSIEESDKPELVWSKYDFVPGDDIIFEDNLLDEENGEFPSRWDLVSGNVENAVFGGENVIMFRGNSPVIVPYLKNPDTDYLPDVFTVEFDLYLPNNSFNVYFYDRKNQRVSSGYSSLDIWPTSMELHPAGSKIPEGKSIANKWVHISIAYTNGKMKAYIDETRLINVPHLSFNPFGISLHAYHASDQNRYYIKNFRLAEGGVKFYDRVLQDGKIVSNGIRFDVGKATIKPESMGVINQIYDLMNEHPDLKFSVEGHTDSDGNDDFNRELSEKRAEAVMNRLISMGISKDRLTSKGFGESVPIATNDTPEGKASNRRVEFVKM